VNEENLSILSLIVNASLPVQAVMGILFIASVMSWIMIVQRGIFLSQAQNNFKDFEDTFWSGVDLAQYYQELTQKAKDIGISDGIEMYLEPAFVNLIACRTRIKPILMPLWKALIGQCESHCHVKMKS
jgi:biopolymer transport protein TolQ